MRNLHLILLQEYGIEARRLFREWERLRLRTSDYKNHRIFSLRCLHKELIPVSIKLKSTVTTSKARQIIRKAEKDLLQARVKAINSMLDQVARQTEDCKDQLASIISAQHFRECQDFINKVSKVRFNKFKQRQLNKFNILVTKKEGNITRANAINLTWSNLVSQPVRQGNNLASRQAPLNSTPAIAHLPPGEGSNNLLAAAHLPLEGSSSSQAPLNSTLAVAHLPPREGSSFLLSTAHLPLEGSSSSQAPLNSTPAIAHLPPGEGSSSLLAAAHLPSEGSSSSQAIPPTLANTTLAVAHLPPEEGSNFPPATVHLPLEGDSSPQVTQSNSQASGIPPTLAIANLPPREGSNPIPEAAHLPSGKGSSSSQATVLLPSREGNNSSLVASLPPYSRGNSSIQASNTTQAGQGSNNSKAVRQGNRCSPRHRATQSSQESPITSWEDNPSSTPQ